MPEITSNVGELIAAYLEACGVTHAYGVISIHNMPILDAFGRRGKIRFVPARGEAGSMNMADAHARVAGGLGVCVTSTGTGAGNAAGGLVEALTAGSPVLHLTGQIDSAHLDRARAFIHEFPAQPALLKAVSKAYFRVWTPEMALGVVAEAVRTALTPPMGPVSVEIPIDVQRSQITFDADGFRALLPQPGPAEPAGIARLAARLKAARRPLLWLGGGARGTEQAVARLAALGLPVMTSVNGRGVLPEDHPLSLGAYTQGPVTEAFLKTCDLLLAVGTRLRSNETKNYALPWPRPFCQIDIDAGQAGRAVAVDEFVCADARTALTALADRLEADGLSLDPALGDDVATMRRDAEAALRKQLGPYGDLVTQLQAALPRNVRWVRDITISNSTWGNRLLRIADSRAGVHALGGGIGQGVPMAVGAALAAGGAKTVCLTGDGGLTLCMTELATAAQENADVTFIVMNDKGYGVIRNIQDELYGKRHYYTDVTTTDHAKLADLMGLRYWYAGTLAEFPAAIAAAVAHKGPALLEVDMTSIGPFASSFAGPPTGKPAA